MTAPGSGRAHGMRTQVAPAVALLGEDDFRAGNAEECFVELSS